MRDDATRTIVFAGGGSGGHLFPALAVDAAIRQACPSAWIKYFCSERPIDAAILDKAGADYETLPSESSARWRTPWKIVLRNWRGYRQARLRLKDLEADCVIGCGGFASVPTVLAARSLGIPIALLEQNVTPGRATRWLARYADAIYASFPETADHLGQASNRVEVTGNPVRPAIARLRGTATNRRPQQILVLGGSLGSRTLNALVAPAVVQCTGLLQGWNIVHQSGAEDVESLAAQYAGSGISARVTPFLDSIESEYVRSSLVICRAGATTLSELACVGLPAVLIPFTGAKDDHQTHNAQWFASRGAAERIDSRQADASERIVQSIEQLIMSSERCHQMAAAMHSLGRPNAASNIAERVLQSPFAPRK